MNRTALLVANSVAAAFLLASSTIQAAAPPTPQGFITAKGFYQVGIGDVSIAGLTNSAKFIANTPDAVFYPNWFEWQAAEDGSGAPTDFLNDYGVQMLGYFYPETTGPVTFTIAGDDFCVLYLSTNDDPATKQLIAQVPGWTTNRQWDKYPEQTSLPQNLTAGKAYYIEALMKEAGGGDALAVSIDAATPIPGTRLSTIDLTLGPVSIVTQPAAVTIPEGADADFKVVVAGTPPFTFQWKLGGVDILDATNQSVRLTRVSFADNAKPVTVAITGAQGAVTSTPAALTVQQDLTAPTILAANGGGDFKSVVVKYSERVSAATATNAANYAISNGITISGAKALDESTVLLTTGPQTSGTAYTLTVNNVKDQAAAGNTIAANTQKQFSGAAFTPGLAVWQRYLAVDGDTGDIDFFLAALDDPTFRGPDAISASGNATAPRGVADNYGLRLQTFFVPPSDGNYVFFLACDDHGYLLLSTDENPANKKKIANQPQWSDFNQWIDPESPDDVRSDTYPSTEWPTGGTITLSASKRYYLEAVFQEGGGGDGLEVTYKLASEADPANGTATRLTGSVIGFYSDPSALPPIITNRPAGAVFAKGETVTLTVGATSVLPLTYQWYKSKVAVAGATSATLTIANADHNAIGDYYVDVTNANGTVSSFPDDSARVIMSGAFLIEAEDFNFASGQTKPEASVMPYTGNAYTNVTTQVNNVDFFNTADESAGAALGYSRFTADQEAVVDMKGPADPADYNRGAFSVTHNYAIGWTDKAEWQNYTRNFPTGNYVVYGGLAYDGRGANQLDTYLSKVANPTIPDGTVPNTEGGLQGLTRLGVFKGPATGAWSSNDILPLKDDATGATVVIALGGTNTIRWTANKADGDVDYLLFYNVEGTTNPPTGPKFDTITLSGNNVTITWTGAGTLQQAGVVGGAAGDWTPVAGAASPFTVPVAAGTNRFYRLLAP